jgi:hypothetical protein
MLQLLMCLPASATTHTFAAPHLTMHVGDPVPPLIFSVAAYLGWLCQSFQWSACANYLGDLLVLAGELSDNYFARFAAHDRPGRYSALCEWHVKKEFQLMGLAPGSPIILLIPRAS